MRFFLHSQSLRYLGAQVEVNAAHDGLFVHPVSVVIHMIYMGLPVADRVIPFLFSPKNRILSIYVDVKVFFQTGQLE